MLTARLALGRPPHATHPYPYQGSTCESGCEDRDLVMSFWFLLCHLSWLSIPVRATWCLLPLPLAQLARFPRSYLPSVASKCTTTTSLGPTRCRFAIACFVLRARCDRTSGRKPQRNELWVHPLILLRWARKSQRCKPASMRSDFLADSCACGRLISACTGFQPANRSQL